MRGRQIVNKYYNHFLTKDDALPDEFLVISSVNLGNLIYEITGFLQSNKLDLDFNKSKKVAQLSLKKWNAKKRKHQKKLKFLEKRERMGTLTDPDKKRLSRLRATKGFSLYKESKLGKQYGQNIESMKLYDSTGNIEIILKNHQLSSFMYEKPNDKYKKGHEIGVCVTINYKTEFFSDQEKRNLKDLNINPKVFGPIAEKLEVMIADYFEKFQRFYKSKHMEIQYLRRLQKQKEGDNKYTAPPDITLKGLRQKWREDYAESLSRVVHFSEKHMQEVKTLDLEKILN